ncbi:Uncharacterized protein MCHI_003827 [Candidatus Magnetoovum chiemensis]|nr:Uncharacterized protein MCHI_003827 [Candidatus Magnetoovum chiemensis]
MAVKTIKARFCGGKIEFLEEPDIPDGAEVLVTFERTLEEKDKWHIPIVSDEEQKEMEEILKDPDCHIVAFTEIVEI